MNLINHDDDCSRCKITFLYPSGGRMTKTSTNYTLRLLPSTLQKLVNPSVTKWNRIPVVMYWYVLERHQKRPIKIIGLLISPRLKIQKDLQLRQNSPNIDTPIQGRIWRFTYKASMVPITQDKQPFDPAIQAFDAFKTRWFDGTSVKSRYLKKIKRPRKSRKRPVDRGTHTTQRNHRRHIQRSLNL